MTTSTLKSNIKKQINNLDDLSILNSIHTLLKEVLHHSGTESQLSKGQKIALNRTLAEHKAGKLKYYTLEQAKKLIDNNSK